MGVEQLVDSLNVRQRKGRFQAPKEVYNDRFLMKWVERIREHEIPLVVAEEKYYRFGLERKLHAPEQIVRSNLVKYGLLRARDTPEFVHKGPYVKEPVDTLSIAQTISWIYKKPIEKVLVSERELRSPEFRRIALQQRLKTLFNAYTGSNLFEWFRQRQERISQRVHVPPLYPSSRLSRQDLRDWLVVDMPTIKRLFAMGFLVSQREFKAKSLNNLVDTVAFAHFFSMLYQRPLNTILKQDTHTEALAKQFIQNRLKQYMYEEDISLRGQYKIHDAAFITGRRYGTIYYAAQKGIIPCNFRGGKTRISGLNLALYALKQSQKQVFSDKDIAQLFGAEIQCMRYDLKPSERGTYSRVHYVFPLYDKVANEVRKLRGIS